MKEYLLYVDILGYEELAKEIAKRTGHKYEDKVREDYLLNPINRTLDKIEQEFENTRIVRSTDNAYLFTTKISNIFRMIPKLSCIEIPFHGFNNIPVELAVDVLEFKESSVVQQVNHIARTETVESLKSNTPHWYKKYFEDKDGTKLKETYVVASKEFHNEIDFLDKDGSEEFSTNSHILYSLDPEKLIHHGKVLEFLEILGLTNSTIYERIDGLFVPPVEFKQIADVLKRLKVVFITGIREYGKTFNAIRLMWETSDQNGCIPSYITTAKFEKLNSSERFEFITDKIKPNHIIYVEDPFGKTNYEPNQELDRSLSNIIRSVEDNENCFLIVTSREEVFRRFEDTRVASIDLTQFQINLTMNSYGYEERKQMILNWGMYFKCIWLNNQTLKDSILEIMKDKSKLSTPLNIKDFCYQGKQMNNLVDLVSMIDERSAETERGFAKDIQGEPPGNQIFLCLLFICKRLRVDVFKSKYEKLLLSNGVRFPWEFERLLEWFSSKIETVRDNNENYLVFSHPSYSNALDYLLLEGHYPSQFSKMFFQPTLDFLATDHGTEDKVVEIITKYYSRLPDESRQILDRITTTQKSRRMIIKSLLLEHDRQHKFFKSADFPILRNEDLLLLNLICVESPDPTLLASLITSDFKWNEVTKVLKEQEKETLEDYSEIIVSKICRSGELLKLRNSFYINLVRRLFEKKLRILFLKKPRRTYSELIIGLQSDPNFVQNVNLLLAKSTIESIFKFTLNHFITKRYVVSVGDYTYRACQALYLTHVGEKIPPGASEDPGFFNLKRVEEQIKGIGAKLYLEQNDEIIQKAVEIARKLSRSPKLIGLEPLRISSVIINMAYRSRGLNRVNSIHDRTAVSEPYLYTKTREFEGILLELEENKES